MFSRKHNCLLVPVCLGLTQDAGLLVLKLGQSQANYPIGQLPVVRMFFFLSFLVGTMRLHEVLVKFSPVTGIYTYRHMQAFISHTNVYKCIHMKDIHYKYICTILTIHVHITIYITLHIYIINPTYI